MEKRNVPASLSHVPIPEDPLDIVIYHIGGEGGYGPIEEVLKIFTNNCMLVVFEARPDTSDLVRKKELAEYNIPVFIINKCVGEQAGRASFYINKFPLSSSIFPPAPRAINEHVVYGDGHTWQCHTWGENTELSSTIEVDTVSIDEIVRAGIVPPPDVLSIDAQGAEHLILSGAKETLREHVLCVVSEVEFFEIYAGQGLFEEQMGLLRSSGFRLADILNTQYWHPGPAAGEGFLTVGEALFLRLLENILEEGTKNLRTFHKLIKLAGIASSFSRLSYCTKIVTHLKEDYQECVSTLKNHPKYKELLNFCEFTLKEMDKYEMNNRHFLDTMNNYHFSSGRWDFSGERTKPQNPLLYKIVTICTRIRLNTIATLRGIIRLVVRDRVYAKMKKLKCLRSFRSEP